MIRDCDFEGKRLGLYIFCPLIIDVRYLEILYSVCDLDFFKLIDCIVKAALNHVNFNPAKMTKLLTKPEKIFQLIIYILFRSPSISNLPLSPPSPCTVKLISH